MKTWTLVTSHFDATPLDWAPWVEIFSEHGIPGTVQNDQPATLGGYLYEGQGVDDLKADLLAAGAREVTIETIEEEDWSIAWRKFFVPRRIGKSILVRPVWEEAELQEGDIELVLDPGQAFGTGDHPTTRMCLELLESVDLTGLSVADIGAGSGILSIAALKMGAARLVAVDSDAASVDACFENAERNSVTMEVHQGAGFDPLGDEIFDGVVSNIISAALIRLAPEASSRVKPGGFWIVSGIIASNWAEVRAVAEKCGFTFEAELAEGEWIAATFRR